MFEYLKLKNREEKLTKLLDEIIIAFCLEDKDDELIKEAFKEIQISRNNRDRYPVTAYLVYKKYIK